MPDRALTMGAAALLNLRDKRVRLVYEQVVARLPYAEGARARRWFLRSNGRLAPDSYVFENVRIIAPWNLCLGREASVSPGAILDCRGGLEIGAYSMVGIEAVVLTSSHGHARLDVPMRHQGLEFQPVRVGEDVWIGARAVILPGVSIGRGAIVAAGAVVTRSVESYAVVGGVPAHVISRRGAGAVRD